MKSKKVNECGFRNSFGYCDFMANEIVLKHPCLKKNDINDVYAWLDDLPDLKKFSSGIGTIETCVTDDNNENLYSTARGVIRQSILQTFSMDNQVLKNFLQKLKNKKALRNLALKCYIFTEDQEMFDSLIQVIRACKNLVYLDLNGCFFTDEQLLDLAEVISQTHVAHLVWPEPRMSEIVANRVAKHLKEITSLVVLSGVPLDFQTIAQDHRNFLFSLARRPTMITEQHKKVINESADSIRLAIAFEKQRLFDLEKTIEAVLA